MLQHLLIFARRPELGRVKTRLAQGVGAVAALAAYEELLGRTRAAADGVAAHRTVWLTAADPAGPVAADFWPGYETRVQPEGDLGARMAAAFAAAFAAGAPAAVVIGTDCPDLGSALLESAFQELAAHDVVLGPAADGGYYLLGMKTLISDFFLHKPWSTAAVLSETLADAQRLGLRVALLPVLRDVDTAEDLAAWRAAAMRNEG